ncbi:MAG: hypothetical protein EOM55_00255 [Clostridia bacterium]|nr:hypothetical protein [Clostridia bacterium]
MLKKIVSFIFGVIFIVTSNIFLSSCGGNNYYYDDGGDDILLQYFDPTLPDGTIEFSTPILDLEHFDRIIPLGQINPPGHTFPTDHIYFVFNGFERTVYAPCKGKILFIEESGMYGDGSIRIGVTNTMAYYLGHIFVNEDLQVGDIVEAGDEIAISSNNSSCVDFGVINKNIDNEFLSQKHPPSTLYGDKPLTFYSEPLRTQLYEKVVSPTPPDAEDFVYDEGVTDGEFAIDLAGTLRGNWFREGCFNSQGWYEWTDELAFGYDTFYPDQIRIGIGTSSYAFAINENDNPLRPEDVNSSSGAVAYYLYNANNFVGKVFSTGREKLMMVQMLSNTRLRLEIFDDAISASREFTSASSFYIR